MNIWQQYKSMNLFDQFMILMFLLIIVFSLMGLSDMFLGTHFNQPLFTIGGGEVGGN